MSLKNESKPNDYSKKLNIKSMIKLFSKIRNQLIKENHSGKYLKYAIG